MKIVIFSWRDIRNPKAGGAEIVTQEHARGWVKKGHSVFIISPAFPNSLSKETIDGIEFIRLGLRTSWNYLFIYLFAFIYYQLALRGNVDLVVDQIHGIPFFTPLYVREKKLVYICEVAKEIWDKMYPRPIALLGRIVEKNYFKIYTKIKFLTISESTKFDLLRLGVKENNIVVIYPGLDRINTIVQEKKKQFTIMYLNRICKMKNLLDIISSFHLIIQKIKNSQLIVAGKISDNVYYEECRNYAHKMGIDKKIIFLGNVQEKEKYRLLSRSHLLLHASVKEGWGLNILEAASQRTPSIVYKTSGLIETVKNGVTGVICRHNTPENMAEEAIKLFQNKVLYRQMQKEALKWTRSFTWKKSQYKSNLLLKTI